MVFSSLQFIFGFLPFVMAGAFLCRKHIRLCNVFLLMASLFFYAWGSAHYVVLILCSIAGNYLLALLIDRNRKLPVLKNVLLAVAVSLNVGMLFVFKYAGWMAGVFGFTLDIVLPIGISFYTFQALSYVADVWRGNVCPSGSIVDLGLYISFFPQLVAGPIVRYIDIEDCIKEKRHLSWEGMADGIRRFTLGFVKKVVFADSFAVIADKAQELNGAGSLPICFAWLGAVAYMLQIYYDFSGYSDMAIGLGKMFGFDFPENFNYPYMASSVTDFWRRWHISLSSWFRDYVYIPLGGNRGSKQRICMNLLTVWLLTGLWHGAGWNFLAWGVYYGVLLIAEKLLRLDRKLCHPAALLYRCVTLLIVLVGWVLFRTESLGLAVRYLENMLPFTGLNIQSMDDFLVMAGQYKWELLLGILGCFPVIPLIERKCRIGYRALQIGISALFVVGISYLVKETYSPFIYFSF